MRCASLQPEYDWNKFLGIGHEQAGQRPVLLCVPQCLPSKAARTLKNDTGTGSARQDAGADLRTDVPYRPLVEDTWRSRHWPDDLAGLRYGAGLHRPLVLRAEGPLPDAVLL